MTDKSQPLSGAAQPAHDSFSKGYTHRHGEPVSDACGEGRHAECTEDFIKCHCTFRFGHTTSHAYMNPPAAAPEEAPPPLGIVQELREIAVYVQSKGMGNIPQKLCKIADELAAAPVAVPAGQSDNASLIHNGQILKNGVWQAPAPLPPPQEPVTPQTIQQAVPGHSLEQKGNNGVLQENGHRKPEPLEVQSERRDETQGESGNLSEVSAEECTGEETSNSLRGNDSQVPILQRGSVSRPAALAGETRQEPELQDSDMEGRIGAGGACDMPVCDHCGEYVKDCNCDLAAAASRIAQLEVERDEALEDLREYRNADRMRKSR